MHIEHWTQCLEYSKCQTKAGCCYFVFIVLNNVSLFAIPPSTHQQRWVEKCSQLWHICLDPFSTQVARKRNVYMERKWASSPSALTSCGGNKEMHILAQVCLLPFGLILNRDGVLLPAIHNSRGRNLVKKERSLFLISYTILEEWQVSVSEPVPSRTSREK